MKTKTILLLIASSLLLLACTDKGTDASEKKDAPKAQDCQIQTDGTVKVLKPKAGEVYSLGDSITVFFAAKYAMGAGFRVLYFPNEDARPVDLGTESVGPESPDGKECYSVTLHLNKDLETSKKAWIKVQDYNSASVSGISENFELQK